MLASFYDLDLSLMPQLEELCLEFCKQIKLNGPLYGLFLLRGHRQTWLT